MKESEESAVDNMLTSLPSLLKTTEIIKKANKWGFDLENGAQLLDKSFFFFQEEDGIRDYKVTGVQTCALPISPAVAAASLAPLWKRNLRRTPLFIWGMVAAHLGIAVGLAGMASESAFTRETLVAARPGDVAEVGPYRSRFEGVNPVAGPNWTANEAVLSATRGAGATFRLRPQARTFSTPPMETNEAAIAARFDGQLYTVLGKPDGNGRWQLRLWWK